ncbi:hypothetical protein HN014_22550 (plasmid) [Aquimarina sp. TRL1]|uniref:hypothetical protein n=1 Tax=Aquimarina sp. (strain TRL1) TaxID=2736252 RepID=UPI00158C7AD7|nr:hypothetical protein [Aquimarina sp. TRL1]QKX07783.1 hypothetical protein HN014_22550 [Aquimarina sp. TRL1]
MKNSTPKDVFQKIVNQSTEGNQHQFSLLIEKPYTQVNDWHTGHKNISLSSLIKIIKILKDKKIILDLNTIFYD